MKRNYRLWITIIIISLTLGLFLAKCIIPDDYRVNLITEFIGVLITVLIVDWLYGLDQNRKEQSQEYQKIVNANNLISIYFGQYIENTCEMCTKLGDPLVDIQNLKLNDLQHMYEKSVYHRLKPIFEKKYILYFKSLEKTIMILKEVLPSLNNKHIPNIVSLLQRFTINNDLNFYLETIIEREKSSLGNEPTIKFDKEMLKDFTGEAKFYSHSNAIDIYMAIYLQIIENRNIIIEYKKEIEKITAGNRVDCR